MQTLLERWRKPIIGLDLVDKNSIPAYFRTVKEVQERGTGWLLLICDIRMPCDTAVLRREIFIEFPGIVVPVHEMNLGISLRSSASWVDMVAAKVSSEIEGLLDGQIGEILVS